MVNQQNENANVDLLAWFDELVKEYPGAESYRSNVEEVRRVVREAFEATEAEVQRARNFMQDKLKRYLIELITTAFDKGSTYTTAILSIGYVGLFTAWSQTSASIPAALSRVVVITALLSLSIFILFEVFKMVYANVLTMRTLAVVKAQGENFDPELQQYLNGTSKHQAIFYSVWIGTILLALTFGIISSGVLIYAHIERLFFPAL